MTENLTEILTGDLTDDVHEIVRQRQISGEEIADAVNTYLKQARTVTDRLEKVRHLGASDGFTLVEDASGSRYWTPVSELREVGR